MSVCTFCTFVQGTATVHVQTECEKNVWIKDCYTFIVMASEGAPCTKFDAFCEQGTEGTRVGHWAEEQLPCGDSGSANSKE